MNHQLMYGLMLQLFKTSYLYITYGSHEWVNPGMYVLSIAIGYRTIAICHDHNYVI